MYFKRPLRALSRGWLVLFIMLPAMSKPQTPRLDSIFFNSWNLCDIRLDPAYFPDSVTRARRQETRFREVVVSHRLLCLFSDGQFATYAGGSGYGFGIWRHSIRGDTLFLRAGQPTEEVVLPVASVRTDKLGFAYDKGEQKIYCAHPLPGLNPEENPFHPVNNQWRVRPVKRENEEALRRRLKNYVGHLVLVFAQMKDYYDMVTLLQHTPRAFYIDRGQFSLIPRETIFPDWAACFYDEQDAERAKEILGSTMREKQNLSDGIDNDLRHHYRIAKELYDSL